MGIALHFCDAEFIESPDLWYGGRLRSTDEFPSPEELASPNLLDPGG